MTPPLWSDVQRDLAAGVGHARQATEKDATAIADGAARENRDLAVGKHVHDAYSAAEAVLERLILAVDGSLPTGPHYHRDLLARAAAPTDRRPPIIGRQTLVELRHLLAFRHVYRHAYDGFDYSLAAPNVGYAAAALPRLAAEIEAFCAASGIAPPAA